MMGSFGFDGRAYGLPKMINYWIVFYNAHIFAEHSLEVPTTWDELMAIAETLKSNGVTPFGLDVVGCRWCSFIWFEEMMVRVDPALYQSVMTGETAYNDPQVIAIMEQWRDLLDAGYFSQPGDFADNWAEPFVNGSIGMFLIGDWYTASLERAGFIAGEDYGIFVMPGITEAGNRSLIIEGRPLAACRKFAAARCRARVCRLLHERRRANYLGGNQRHQLAPVCWRPKRRARDIW